MDENTIKKLAKNACPYVATVYRSVSLRHSRSRDIVSGEGSFRFGGRWNPPGVRANYGSLTPEGAMAETLASARYHGFAAHSAMPRIFVAMQVQLSLVLDLTDPAIGKAGGFRASSFNGVDWRSDVSAGRLPITQMIGRSAAACGLEAILVPSAASVNDQNLVTFVDNLLGTSEITVMSATDLDV